MSTPRLALLFIALFATLPAAGRDRVVGLDGREPKRVWVPHDTPQHWHTPGRLRWTEWWEFNRTAYLRPPERETASPLEEDPEHERARRLLRDLLAAEGDADRAGRPFYPAAYAAVALGRMGDAGALPALLDLTRHDAPAVRRAAWVALGLLGTTEARAALFDEATPRTGHDELARVVGIGMLPRLADNERAWLLQRYRETDHREVRRMLAWVFRVHEPEKSRDLMRYTLDRTDDPFLAVEAILALGRGGDADDEAVIAAIYRNTGDRLLPPIVLRMRTGVREIDHAPLDDRPHLGYVPMSEPVYAYDLLALRGAAAVALGEFGRRRGRSEGRAALRDPFEEERVELERGEWWYPGASDFHFPDLRRGYSGNWDTYVGVERRLGLISLGGLAEDADLRLFADIIDLEYENGRVRPREMLRHAPLREYAVIAQGVFMHEAREAAAAMPDDRRRRIAVEGRLRDAERLVRDLVRVIDNRREPAALRAAAAVAIGLSGDPANADALVAVLPADEPVVLAYGALALGMLGDARAVDVAERVLRFAGVDAAVEPTDPALIERLSSPPGPGLDDAARLALRATVTGVGLAGDAAGGPLLRSILGLDPYVDQDAVRSLKWLGDAGVLPVAMAVAESGDTPVRQRVAAIWAIGELLDPEPLSRAEVRLQQDAVMVLPLHRANAARVGGVGSQVPGAPRGAFTVSLLRKRPPENGAYAMFGYFGNEFLWDAWIAGGRGPDDDLGQSYGVRPRE